MTTFTLHVKQEDARLVLEQFRTIQRRFERWSRRPPEEGSLEFEPIDPSSIFMYKALVFAKLSTELRMQQNALAERMRDF